MRGELEELVRLVEAVRLVDTSMVDELGGGEAEEGEDEGGGVGAVLGGEGLVSWGFVREGEERE